MKSLLYIGNLASVQNAPVSMMETHGALLEAYFQVFYASKQPNKWLRLFDMIATFLRRRREVSCVIIATYSTLSFWYAWAIALLCRAFQKPYIAYLHGGDLPNRLRRSPRMSRSVFNFSLANVAPSGYLEAAFGQAGFSVLRIPNFIQIEKYRFKQREKLHPRLLWVRSFEKSYHPEMTLLVFAEVQKTYPDAQLCMVGPDKDGSMERCKNLAAALGLTRQIAFAGRLPKAQWIALAADYDIFISSTRFDNTPVSVIEAMALGLPVVSTNVGGVPYLIEHGVDGLLSPKDDISAMTEHIKSLLGNPDLGKRICQKARQKAETFDWKIVEKKWLDLIQQSA